MNAEQGPSPVYAVTYDHIGAILWGVRGIEESLRKERDFLERHPAFRTGWDHEAYTYDYLAEHQPDLLKDLRQALADFNGRLGVGTSTYGQPLSCFIDGESNIRQLTFALETVEKHFGRAAAIYIMSEHAFHAQLPQLLAGAGFRGAVLRTHFMMYGHNPEADAPVVWWRGVDGSRIKTLPTYKGQADTAPRFRVRIPGNTSTLDNRILTDALSDDCRLTLADFRRRFGARIRPLVATRADDMRSRENLIQAHEGDPNCRWALLEDAFEILPEPQQEFAPAPNEFKSRMPWGYIANSVWRMSRQAEVKVLTAERLAAIGAALGGPSLEERIEKAWKNLLAGQHHDIQVCGLLDEARKLLGGASGEADAVSAQVLAAIAPRIGDGETVVFNPLPWPRTDLVESSAGLRLVSVPPLGFVSIGPHNSAAPAASEPGPPFEWTPDGVQEPALAYHVWEKTPTGGRTLRVPENVGRLRTPFYEVFTGERGGFRLVRDRTTKADLLALPTSSGTLAALVDARDCVSEGKIVAARIEDHRAVLVEEGTLGPLPYRSEWTFYRHTRRFDWRGEVTFNAQMVGRTRQSCRGAQAPPAHQPLLESVTGYQDHEHKLRLRFFPYVSPYTTAVRDMPFHLDETPDPCVQGLYWTAVSDGSIGVALFNKGLMGSVRESDGAFSSILAFSLPYVWSSRASVLSGKYEFELGVLPFTGHWREADLHRQALEYDFPCVAQPVSRPAATVASLGSPWSPYEETGDGHALLSALYAKRGRLYARFCEPQGRTAKVGFKWLGRPVALSEVDLRERPLRAESDPDAGQTRDAGGAPSAPGLSTTLAPWRILTVEFGDLQRPIADCGLWIASAGRPFGAD